MGLGVNPINNYDIYKQSQSVQQTSMGANPFAAGEAKIGGKQGSPSFEGNSRHLDSTMLAEKKAGFQNGLGGSPVPPETSENFFYSA